MTSQGRARKVVLKASQNKAKYLRALPLHHTQSEVVHEDYTLFSYRLYLTNDLVAEILSHGVEIEVVSPPELRALVAEQLKGALALYE